MVKRINFQEFREKNKVAADRMRSICKQLDVPITREGTEFFMSEWSSNYGMKTETLLEHALIEYRETGYITKTVAGEFIKLKIENENEKNSIEEEKIITDFVATTDEKYKNKLDETRKPHPSLLVSASSANKIAGAGSSIMKNAGDDYEKLMRIIQAIQSIPQKNTSSNVLQAQQSLLEAVEKNFLLNHEQVGDLTGYTKTTISGKKDGWIRYGFTFRKVKEGASTLWRVNRE